MDDPEYELDWFLTIFNGTMNGPASVNLIHVLKELIRVMEQHGMPNVPHPPPFTHQPLQEFSRVSQSFHSMITDTRRLPAAVFPPSSSKDFVENLYGIKPEIQNNMFLASMGQTNTILYGKRK
eukprot:GFUD01136924.1.p1 GENE.GFUD01136924.1~~GFUD01136924.1.p1  ORF type:complete len:123 (-),score=6.48 GFUD01136924.1:59-427(-)